jgi:hypothetical protein
MLQLGLEATRWRLTNCEIESRHNKKRNAELEEENRILKASIEEKEEQVQVAKARSLASCFNSSQGLDDLSPAITVVSDIMCMI